MSYVWFASVFLSVNSSLSGDLKVLYSVSNVMIWPQRDIRQPFCSFSVPLPCTGPYPAPKGPDLRVFSSGLRGLIPALLYLASVDPNWSRRALTGNWSHRILERSQRALSQSQRDLGRSQRLVDWSDRPWTWSRKVLELSLRTEEPKVCEPILKGPRPVLESLRRV